MQGPDPQQRQRQPKTPAVQGRPADHRREDGVQLKPQADANNAGLWLELDAILAAVIGGASLYGGRLGLSLALLGVWTLQGLKLAILRSGLPAEYNLIVMALLIAVVLALQSPAGGRAWRRLTPSHRETAP